MIIIDTHIWVWWHSSPDRLSTGARELIQSEPQIGMSVLSIYECIVAIEKGTIQTSLTAAQVLKQWIGALDIIRLPVTESIVIASRELKFSHSDPFDRIIAATAFEHKAPLVTADRNLLSLDWLKTVPT